MCNDIARSAQVSARSPPHVGPFVAVPLRNRIIAAMTSTAVAPSKAMLTKCGVSLELWGTVQGVIENKTMPPNTKLQELKQIGLQENLAYKSQRVRADEHLVHANNRDNQMLDWYLSHQNLLEIKIAGANISKVDDAMAFEIPTDEASAKALRDANAGCIEAAGGHLAPLNGRERFADVGCSHFTASIKAVLAGCPTPFDDSRISRNGQLSKESLVEGDRFMLELIEQGWAVFTWRSFCQSLWPSLPATLEGALNANNSINKPKSELQCMAAAANRLKGGVSHANVVASLAAHNPVCAAYLDPIVKLAAMFNECNVRVDALTSFGARFGETKRLGEEYISAVAGVTFHGGLVYPEMRMLLLAINITASKSVDGVARLAWKTDMNTLKGASGLKAVKETVDSYNEAVNCVKRVGTATKATSQGIGKLSSVAMRCGVRLALHDLRKGKLSAEAKEYKSKDEIKNKFIEEVQMEIDEMGISFEAPWKIFGWQTAADEKKGAAEPVAPLDSPLDIVRRSLGGGVESTYMCKLELSKKRGFRLTSLPADSSGNVKLSQIVAVTGMPKAVLEVCLTDFVNQWKLCAETDIPKTYVPRIESVPGACFKHSEQMISVFHALKTCEVSCQNVYKDKIVFQVQPNSVWATADFEKGGLRFASYTSLKKIISDLKSEAMAGQFAVVGDGARMKICKPDVPDISSNAPNTEDGGVVPYWWVRVVRENPTMAIKTIDVKGCTIPIMTNLTKIEAFTELTVVLPQPPKKTMSVASCSSAPSVRCTGKKARVS